MNQAEANEPEQQPESDPAGESVSSDPDSQEVETVATDSEVENSAPELPPAAPPDPTANPPAAVDEEAKMDWYILKVAFNREDSIADALRKRVRMEGMEEFFGEVVVPTEDVATFTRDGKRRVSKRKLLPGYIMVNMLINDDTWFLVRETGGISDFTGSAGKPMPMEPSDIERFINRPVEDEEDEPQIKIGIPFKVGDQIGRAHV